MGFARQEYWSGLPLPSPFSHIGYHKILSRVPFAIQWFSHLIVSDSCDPMDCSLLGSFANGIIQARILEWVAISLAQLGGPWAQTYDFYSAVHPMPAAPWPAPPPATLPPAPRAHLSALSSHSCRQPVTPYLFQHLLKNLFSELK